MTRKVLLAICLVLLAGAGYLLLVPPAAVRAPRPEWVVVEGPENAWHDYHKLAGQKDPVSFDELIAAARKKGSQRFFQAPVLSPTEIPYNYRDEKNLATRAAAEVTRLTKAGQLDKALALALATYEMGTDLAETGSDLAPGLAAAATRHEVVAALEALLQQPKLTLAQAEKARAEIKALNARMPTPGQLIAWDREAQARGLEDVLSQEAPPLPGLKVRMLNSVQERLAEQSKVLSEAMDSWDPEKVGRAQELANQIRTRSSYLKEAIPTLDTNLPSALRLLYQDRQAGYGLECLADVAVYVRKNKKLPPSLPEAPKDPRTGEPPTYKVEGKTAVITYPGEQLFRYSL